MREKVRDKGRLEHILQCCDKLIAYKDQYVLDDLKDNSLIFYGFVKLVEIIGEAAYMLTKEFRNKHPEVEWRAMEGMCHVLVHGYYTINPKDLWVTVENDIPVLKVQIENMLATEDFPNDPFSSLSSN